MKRIISLLFLAFLVDASSLYAQHRVTLEDMMGQVKQVYPCLLYTSDAADD